MISTSLKRLCLVMVAVILLTVVLGAIVPSNKHQFQIAVELLAKWSTGPESTFTISITNTTDYPIQLQEPQVDYSDREGVARSSRNPLSGEVFGIMWKDVEPALDGEVTLQPKKAVRLEFKLSSDTQKVRVGASYKPKWGVVRKTLAQGISKLPLRYFPRRSYTWLAKNGLTHPTYQFLEATPWLLNPAVQRTAPNRSAELLKRTHVVAGTRR